MVQEMRPTQGRRRKTLSDFDHVWQWEGSWWRPVYRKGQACRILVRAPKMNSVLVEFEDGFKVNTSRWAVRPIRQVEREQLSFFQENDNG